MKNKHKSFTIKHQVGFLKNAPFSLLASCIDRMIGYRYLNLIYRRARTEAPMNDQEAMVAAVKHANLSLDYSEKDLAHVPKEGGCIVVANHPTGLAETLLLFQLITKVRPDVKFLANPMLNAVEFARPFLIPLNPFATKKAKQENRRRIVEALDWLREGHVLLMFPAGEVAHKKTDTGELVDNRWSPLPIFLARKAKTPILPVNFHGKNRWWFYAPGYIHPLLRTLFIPWAFKSQAKLSMTAYIGTKMPDTVHLPRDQEVAADWLRIMNHAFPATRYRQEHPVNSMPNAEEKPLAAVVRKVSEEKIQQLVAALPDSMKIYSEKQFTCYVGTGEQLGDIMLEIGYQRERTFRAIGEGTGKDCDLDQYDPYYCQVFLWDNEKQQLGGGYRIGYIEDLIETRGADSVFLSTFYDHWTSLLTKECKTAELGRSFITEQYQRSFKSLLTLWKGVSRHIATVPGYRAIVGQASISRNMMSDFALQLFIACLRRGAYATSNKFKIVPKVPYNADFDLPKELLTLAEQPLDFNQIKMTIESLDSSEIFIPPLLKQYCQQMNSQCLTFSVDKDFGYCVDVLCRSDLKYASANFLKRYAGEEATQVLMNR